MQNNKWYRAIQISKGLVVFVHRLVWEVFKGPIPEGLVVNHKNAIKTDNRIENIEVVSQADNIRHAFHNGLHSPRTGTLNSNSKLTEEQVLAILKRKGEINASIAREYNVSRCTISDIMRGTKWRHLHPKKA